MHTARQNLNVTAHNVANQAIPGFSRQVTVQSALPAINLRNGRGMFGTGSAVHNVIQMRDHFIDRRFWGQSGVFGEHSVKVPQLNLIQAVFNELAEGGANSMGAFQDFFSRIQELTANAHDPTFRSSVVKAGDTLAAMIRSHAEALQQQQRDINGEVRAVVTEINGLGQQITALNQQIRSFEFDGSHANDLRDQRALLIDRLSELVNIRVEERDFSHTSGIENDRRLLISMNGYDFINNDTVNTLRLVPRPAGQERNEMDVPGLYDIRFQNGAPFNIFHRNLTGVLKGLIDVRDGNALQTWRWPAEGQALIRSQMEALGFRQDQIADLQRRLSEIGLDSEMAARLVAFQDRLAELVDGADTDAGSLAYRQLNATNVITAARGRIDGASTLRGINDDIDDILDEIYDFLDNVGMATGDSFNRHAFDTLLTRLRGALNDAEPDYITEAELALHLSAVNAILPVSDIETIELVEAAHIEIAHVTEQIRRINAQLNQVNVISEDLVATLTAAYNDARTMAQRIEARINELESPEDDAMIAIYENALEQIELQADYILFQRNELLTLIESADDAFELYEFFLSGEIGDLRIADALHRIDLILDAAGTLPAPDPNHRLYPYDLYADNGATTIFRGIPFYMNRLNEMVRVFARAINEGLCVDGNPIPGSPGHRNGFGSDGRNGRDFFTWTDSQGNPVEGVSHNLHHLNALNFSINDLFIRYPHLLGTDTDPTRGESANDVILGFIEVNNFASLFREGRLEDFIIATTGFLAIDIQQSGRFRNNYNEMRTATANQRAAVSDVDQNEEMLNMSRFRQLYNINARMIATMNEVYDTLINRLGIG